MTSYGSAWSVLLGHMLQQPSVKTRIENVVVLQQRSRSFYCNERSCNIENNWDLEYWQQHFDGEGRKERSLSNYQ